MYDPCSHVSALIDTVHATETMVKVIRTFNRSAVLKYQCTLETHMVHDSSSLDSLASLKVGTSVSWASNIRMTAERYASTVFRYAAVHDPSSRIRPLPCRHLDFDVARSKCGVE